MSARIGRHDAAVLVHEHDTVQRTVSLADRKTERAAERVPDPAAFRETSAAETDHFARRLTLLPERMADDPNVLTRG